MIDVIKVNVDLSELMIIQKWLKILCLILYHKKYCKISTQEVCTRSAHLRLSEPDLKETNIFSLESCQRSTLYLGVALLPSQSGEGIHTCIILMTCNKCEFYQVFEFMLWNGLLFQIGHRINEVLILLEFPLDEPMCFPTISVSVAICLASANTSSSFPTSFLVTFGFV